MRYNSFLTKVELKVGVSYLFKDGRVGIYLGKSAFDRYVFYIACRAFLIGDMDVYLAHEKIQSEYIKGICSAIFKEQCDLDALCMLRTFPQLYCKLDFIPDFEPIIDEWWTKNMLTIKGLPNLVTTAKELAVPYVSAKELVPGELYYTGSLWRALYLVSG